MDSIAARVARGAKLLDEKLPGWWQQVNLNELEVSSPCRCVLGQLGNASYQTGLKIVGMKSLEELPQKDWDLSIYAQIGHGFEGSNDYSALTAEWRSLISLRRATAVPNLEIVTA